MTFITKSEITYKTRLKPISAKNFDSRIFCTNGLNFGNKIIVIIKAKNHFEKYNKLLIKPFAVDCAVEYKIIYPVDPNPSAPLFIESKSSTSLEYKV